MFSQTQNELIFTYYPNYDSRIEFYLIDGLLNCISCSESDEGISTVQIR